MRTYFSKTQRGLWRGSKGPMSRALWVLKGFQDLLMDLQDTILILQVLGKGSREDFRDLWVFLKSFQRHPVVFEGGSRGHQGL